MNHARYLDHYVCRESGLCPQLLPWGSVSRSPGFVVALIALALLLSTFVVRLERVHSWVDRTFPAPLRKAGTWVRPLSLGVLLLLAAYLSWGSTAWLS